MDRFQITNDKKEHWQTAVSQGSSVETMCIGKAEGMYMKKGELG